MADDQRSSHASNSHVPIWNGKPEWFQAFEDEVSLFLMGEDLSQKVSLAARIAQRLTGATRRIALSMKRDLYPLDGASSESAGNGWGKLGHPDAAATSRYGEGLLLG